ncbi:hypothetical protein [Cryptosporangium aurantiacum]|uniref:Uncharacterized protein n=1 Tax=Cryptosporangium aurantiacum TaxID=134849 RepID=A0A1M7RK44_9ACTN|nr:hypothetical protein [Cryptosporangium aurantiacum]SHN46634.1 hypothetical protein SAMN05443668_11717 [Cryptosporangium aurantiacum]
MELTDAVHTWETDGFVVRAGVRELLALGFPPPGHPFWTPDTLAGMALRYPALDLTPWSDAADAIAEPSTR